MTAIDEARPGDSDVPGVEERRMVIETVALGHFDIVREAWAASAPNVDPVEQTLQAICAELLALSIRTEQSLDPALKTLGAMVGGLFGIDRDPNLDADEEADDLFAAGRRLRGEFNPSETVVARMEAVSTDLRDIVNRVAVLKEDK